MPSLTIENAESSFLKGKAEFEKWKANFEDHWFGPQVLDQLQMMVNQMPVESRIIDPVSTAIVERAIRNKRGG